MVEQERYEKDLELIGPGGVKHLLVDGCKAVVMRHTSLGHLCGYVEVPKDQGISVDELVCHGGVTYEGSDIVPFPTDNYYIGFDCAHAGDYVPSVGRDGVYRDYEYVVEEIKGLVQQLKERVAHDTSGTN